MARPIKVFYINEGYDGVVCAKNTNQVAHLLNAPWAYGGKYGYSKAQILKSIKSDDGSCECDFTITKVKTVPQKGIYSKAKILGWIQC